MGNPLSSIADLIFPRVCTVCGRELLPQEKDICIPCLADLPETHFNLLERNPMSEVINALSDEKDSYFQYINCLALFFYSPGSGYERITRSLKYGRNFSAGKHFASMLAQRIASSPIYSDLDAITCVPLHPVRRWKRGYNQAEIIGRTVAGELGIPFEGRLLFRTRNTGTQTSLESKERMDNISGAFGCRDLSSKTFRHIMIMDDVCTTGATLAECCRTLRKKLPAEVKISAGSLAYVE